MTTKLTSEERAIAYDLIATALTEAAAQETLEDAYYNVQVEHLEGLGDVELLDAMESVGVTLEDL